MLPTSISPTIQFLPETWPERPSFWPNTATPVPSALNGDICGMPRKGTSIQLLAQEAIQHLIPGATLRMAGGRLARSVRIYDAKTGSLVKTLAKSGSSVALSTAGLLATASKSTVRVWRTSDWTEVYSLPDMAPRWRSRRTDDCWRRTRPTGVHVYNSADGKLVAEIPDSMPPFALARAAM